jgi:hypothetical protein
MEMKVLDASSLWEQSEEAHLKINNYFGAWLKQGSTHCIDSYNEGMLRLFCVGGMNTKS